jgi:hypothetical protein
MFRVFPESTRNRGVQDKNVPVNAGRCSNASQGRAQNLSGTKAASEARLSYSAGLTGRYFGGQATQQEQRFDARGEDPDQFAGWFEQTMIASPHLRSFGRLCEFMSGNHRGDRSLFSIRLLNRQTGIEGFVRSELTFSLVLTAAMLTDLIGQWKGVMLFSTSRTAFFGLAAATDPLLFRSDSALRSHSVHSRIRCLRVAICRTRLWIRA